jgi:hypothetical protein
MTPRTIDASTTDLNPFVRELVTAAPVETGRVAAGQPAVRVAGRLALAGIESAGRPAMTLVTEARR